MMVLGERVIWATMLLLFCFYFFMTIAEHALHRIGNINSNILAMGYNCILFPLKETILILKQLGLFFLYLICSLLHLLTE